MAAGRPGGVTFVAVLVWIVGALDILAGVLLLFQTNDPTIGEAFGGSAGLVTSAILSILIGLVSIIVAGGLLRGNSAARAIVTVVQVLSIAGSVWLAIAVPANAVSEVLGIVISVIVLIFLWSRRANEFFRG